MVPRIKMCNSLLVPAASKVRRCQSFRCIEWIPRFIQIFKSSLVPAIGSCYWFLLLECSKVA